MNIYLDIDGVLVTKDHQATQDADEFLAYTLQNYPDTTYWLTTHCQDDADKTVAGSTYLFS